MLRNLREARNFWLPLGGITLALATITFLHYTTAPALSRLHTVYRYFYFLPIVYAALRFGYWGGLLTALTATIAFAPHIFFKWGSFPEDSLNDLLVVFVFFGVAIITGVTVDRLRRAEARQAFAVKRLEASLHQLEVQGEELRRAERLSALGLLAGGLAHEIRNPVGIIRASAQLLSLESGPELAETADVIQQETERIERLIQDLLDYAGDTEPARVPVEVLSLFTQTAERLKPLTTSSNIVLTVDAARDLPSICVDGMQMERALLNICMNAIQAMGDTGHLALQARPSIQRPGYVELLISDTGPGIPETFQNRIFDPFFTTRDDGAGLGLSVVQRTIDDHHGRIWVESEQGSGTTFVLQLPVC